MLREDSLSFGLRLRLLNMSDMLTTRVEIMNLIKDNLKSDEKWDAIENELSIECSNLEQPTNEELKNKLIDDLYKIKTFLSKQGFNDLAFLQEEIARYSTTVQISTHSETSDAISKDVIAQYARLSHNREGIVGISKKFSYEQVKKLINGVYKSTGLVKFYISNEKQIPGKIVAEIYEHPQSIPLASLIQSRKGEDDDSRHKKIILFGDGYNNREYTKIKEIKAPLYVYKFVSDLNKEMIVFSIEKMQAGDYIISGMETECDDTKMLTASAKLATKLPHFFAQSFKSRIEVFKTKEQFIAKIKSLNVNYETLYEYAFTLKVKNQNLRLKYHPWFKDFMWSWLVHSAQGLREIYPMHIYIAGPPATGKSMIIETIHEKVRETNEIFSGVSSTLKKLVPSFKYMPMQHGYMAESNRFAFCDEFLRCIVNAKNNSANSDRDESVGMMNDLLEHKKRVVGSGVSSGSVLMTARTLAVSNPVRGTGNMLELMKNLDASFLSRWVIYYQGKDDIDLVRNSDDEDLEELKYNMNDYDFVSIIDYLQSFDSEFDKKRLNGIFEEARPLLCEELQKHYNSRQKHHIQCIMDGVIKTRCLMTQNSDFVAIDEDYEKFRIIWSKIVRSWIDFEEVRMLPVAKRIYYMPVDAQYLYNVINKQKKDITRVELFELVKSELTESKCIENLMILASNQIIKEVNGVIRPHWMKVELGV